MPIFFVRAPEKNRQNILSQKQLSRVCKKCVEKNSTILFFELATRIFCQKKSGCFFSGSSGKFSDPVFLQAWGSMGSGEEERPTLKGWSGGSMGSGEEEGLNWQRHGLPGANRHRQVDDSMRILVCRYLLSFVLLKSICVEVFFESTAREWCHIVYETIIILSVDQNEDRVCSKSFAVRNFSL